MCYVRLQNNIFCRHFQVILIILNYCLSCDFTIFYNEGGAYRCLKELFRAREFHYRHCKSTNQNIVSLNLSQGFLHNIDLPPWQDSQKNGPKCMHCWLYNGSPCLKIQFNIYYQLLHLFKQATMGDINVTTLSSLDLPPPNNRATPICQGILKFQICLLEFNAHIFGHFRLVVCWLTGGALHLPRSVWS